MGAFFALSTYVFVKVDGLEDGWLNRGYQHHEEFDTERQSVEVETPIAPTFTSMSPVTPSTPRPDPLIPTIYPPPYNFPFEHFRGTGESLAPSRQYFHVKRPRYTPPAFYKDSTFLEIIEDVQRPDEGVSAVAEDAEPTGTIEADLAEMQESAEPLHEEVEQAQPCPDTPSPPPRDNALSSLPETPSTQTPSKTPLQTAPQTTPQIPRLPEPPSPKTILVNALNRVAQEKHKIQEQTDGHFSQHDPHWLGIRALSLPDTRPSV